ncbi:MAG: cytochrome c family protein [Hydrogenophilaceae bacterium]|jgi:cytochrome c|nr:cytochrome c family protein [Hydrogenophilaceae bacterium]
MSNFNAIAGAVLASVLGVMTVSTIADSVFATAHTEKHGYLPKVAATGGGGAAVEERAPDFGRLFADPAALEALIARGQRATGVCVACHTFDAGGPNRIGPNLHDVFGADIASHSGFAYSDALTGMEGVWTYDTLDRFLSSPMQTVRGTKMQFAGVRNTDDRVAIIAYLRSLSPNPPPLPAPLPEEAPAEAGAAAEGAPAEAAPAAEATPG